MKIALVSSLLVASSLAFAPLQPHSSRVSKSSYGTATFMESRILVGKPTILSSRSLVSLAAKKEGQAAVLEKEETQLIPTGTDDSAAVVNVANEECAVPAANEELSETQKLMQQVKDAGVAGVISYALWELGFWLVSVPVVIFGYYAAVGHFPDLSDKDDLTKLGAEAFAFVNFARFAVPLRIGLALSTTPWIQTNIVDRYMKKEEDACEETVTAEQSPVDAVEVEPLVQETRKQVPRWRSFLPFGRRKI